MPAGPRGAWLVVIVAVALVALAGLAAVACGPGAGGATTVPAGGTATTLIPGDGSMGSAPPVRETLGSSLEGRAIEAVTFGGGSRHVLICGGIHGDETGGEAARQLLDYLEGHRRALPKDVAVTIVPSVNPDGEADGTRGNAAGVDINRNFPTQDWSGTLDDGDRPSAGLTGGSAPGSEPETKALLLCLERGFHLVISLHSQGGIIDFDGPGGLAVAERISAMSGLPVKHLDYQEYVTGSLGTYVPEEYGVPVITVELEGTVLTNELRDALVAALGEASAP